MHRLRLELVNNRYLFEAGQRHGVPSVLASRPFTSRHFVPPNMHFADVKDKPPPSVAIIGDKTIADAVEALVGAAVETGFERSGLREAFSLALLAIKSLGKVQRPGCSHESAFSDSLLATLSNRRRNRYGHDPG